MQLVRTELRTELRALIGAAFEGGKPVASPYIPVAFNGTPQQVAMLVRPRQTGPKGQWMALVCFIEGGAAKPGSSPEEVMDNGAYQQLQEELRQIKARLRIIQEEYESANEELRASNEEFQSVNEEYRSTAEELETSKEELHSINEELQTLNSELKSTLEEVSQANNDLENLMAATGIATLFIDRKLQIKRYNPALTQLFNIKQMDRGRSMGDITHHLNYEALEADARRVLVDLISQEVEICSQKSRWYLVRLRPYRTTDDRIDGVVITFVDITDRKRSEEALQESQQRLEQELAAIQRLHRMGMEVETEVTTPTALAGILQAALDIVAADFGAIQLLEPGVNKLLVAAQLRLPSSFQEHLEGIKLDETSAYGQAILTHQRQVCADVAAASQETTQREVANATGYRAMQTTPLISRNSELFGLLSTYWREPHPLSPRDERLLDLLALQAGIIISRLRSDEALCQSEQQLKRQAEVLKNHDRRKNDFLALLGHELRNPLGAITSSLEALVAILPHERRTTALLEILSNQARHMAHLIEDLMDITRINTGKIHLRCQRVNLAEVVDAVITACQPQIDARQLHLQLELPAEPLWLNADPHRLQQIIHNLLHNAIKYSDVGGELGLRATSQGRERLIFTVWDSGIGIAPEALPRIFEPFVQVSDQLQHRQSGLGLGLALVKQLVRLHQGSVTAYSEGKGKGCQVTVELPLAPGEPAAASTSADGPAEAPAPQRILLVDDNVNVTAALELLLTINGHQVKTLNSGAEALATAKAFCPTVALVDISMPEMDGWEVAQQLRTEYIDKRLIILAITGYGLEMKPIQLAAMGFDGHLLKPVQLADLNVCLNTLLAQRGASSTSP